MTAFLLSFTHAWLESVLIIALTPYSLQENQISPSVGFNGRMGAQFCMNAARKVFFIHQFDKFTAEDCAQKLCSDCLMAWKRKLNKPAVYWQSSVNVKHLWMCVRLTHSKIETWLAFNKRPKSTHTQKKDCKMRKPESLTALVLCLRHKWVTPLIFYSVVY